MLKIINNWEYLTYAIGGVEVPATDILEVQIGGVWYKTQAEPITVPYNDMGHRYEAKTHKLRVLLPVLGTDTLVTVDNALAERIQRIKANFTETKPVTELREIGA